MMSVGVYLQKTNLINTVGNTKLNNNYITTNIRFIRRKISSCIFFYLMT